MHQQEGQTYHLHGQAQGEQSRDGMLLPSHGVHLQRQQDQVDEEKYQVHFQRVLLVEGEVERQRNVRRMVGIAVHQPEVVRNVRHRGHVEASAIEVMPLAGRRVPVAGHHRHIPESGREREETHY